MIVEFFDGRIISPYNKKDVSGKFEIKKPEKRITNPQLKYYWGVLVKTVSDYTGYSKDETHAKFGYMFRLVKGKGTPYVRSLKDLTTIATEEQNENIRRWAAETLELSIKTPNEVDYSQIEEQ